MATLVLVGSLSLLLCLRTLFQRITFLPCRLCLSSIHCGPVIIEGNGGMQEAGRSAGSQESHVGYLRKEGFKFLSWGGGMGKDCQGSV